MPKQKDDPSIRVEGKCLSYRRLQFQYEHWPWPSVTGTSVLNCTSKRPSLAKPCPRKKSASMSMGRSLAHVFPPEAPLLKPSLRHKEAPIGNSVGLKGDIGRLD